MKFGSNSSFFPPTDEEGAILLGFRDKDDDVDETGREDSFLRPPPPRPRERFGVAEREPGGVSMGDEVPEPSLVEILVVAVVVAVVVVVADPNNSKRRSSYLRCFSPRSRAAMARCSSTVGFFFFLTPSSSSSSEEARPFVFGAGGPFRESRRGGGLKSAALGMMPRVSRK